MNIGKMINDFYYFSSEQEGRGRAPVGFVTKLVDDYQTTILPAVLGMLPEEFSAYFMDNYFCCGYTVSKVCVEPLDETVTMVLERRVSAKNPHKETVCFEFLNAHPISIFHDDEDYPLPLKGAIIFGFTITFSSKSNRVKPSGKRPFRCNILLNNRLSIDLMFSSVRFTRANP